MAKNKPLPSEIKHKNEIYSLGHNILAKIHKVPFPNINVVCDMLQMLCGHKNLSNIEVRGRGTGKLDFFFTFATIYGQDCLKMRGKNERISP